MHSYYCTISEKETLGAKSMWQIAVLAVGACAVAVVLCGVVPMSGFYAGIATRQGLRPAVSKSIAPTSAGFLGNQFQAVPNQLPTNPTEGSAAEQHNIIRLAAVTTGVLSLFAMAAKQFLAPARIGMAAYQSQFAHGVRHTVMLEAAAADDVDIAKKLDALKKEAQEKMEAALEATANKFSTVRTGRANPAMLDRIRVEYYGALTPLKQVAGISIPDASTIVISPFDRSSISAIEKAIANSDVGLSPSNDGQVIRIKVPPLTEDRRKEMVKMVSKMGEEGKVAIRNVRRDVLKSADKFKLSENAEEGLKGDVQKITDKFVKKLDELIAVKEKDLTTV